jgi:hypothetical protein
MTYDSKQFIALAHSVSAHAAAGQLAPETAVQFCRVVLPALLVEIDIAKRVEERLNAAFPAAETCPATICSSRWKSEEKPAKAKKKAAKKPRRKKEVKDDRSTS